MAGGGTLSLRQIGFEMLEGYPGGGFWGARRLSQGR